MQLHQNSPNHELLSSVYQHVHVLNFVLWTHVFRLIGYTTTTRLWTKAHRPASSTYRTASLTRQFSKCAVSNCLRLTTVLHDTTLRHRLKCRDYNCDSTTIRLRSDYDVSRAPASIRRDSTPAKMNMSIFRRSRIVVESQLWCRLKRVDVCCVMSIHRLHLITMFFL